ncbi:MAG: phage tail length tape measure family protein [Sphingobium sp.]|uniref:phage tail length tape measure family protein n=1 Tax=Sphingobium sp. TaxID=1912891 RepID=UPI0029B8493C|nr:phage tail length tape measure family protein [Sphingobium sp.]MDX3908424.1 phage tail length tape measure family protein [Sphingobium sp.]
MADDVKSLLIRVDATTELLRGQMKQAEVAVGDFDQAVEQKLNKLEQRFSGLNTGNLTNSLKSVEKEFQASFTTIQKIAAQAIEGPRLKSGDIDLGAGAARVAAENARKQAAAIGLVADAAKRAAGSESELTRENQIFIQAAEAARTKANLHAAALEKDAGALERLQIELRAAGNAQQVLDGHQRNGIVVSGQQRAAFQQLSYQANDVAVGFAAGTPAMIIFAQQSGQVIQALGLMTDGAKGFLGFLGGPWGLGITTALVVLTPFVGKLLEGNDALGKAVEKLREDGREAEISRQAHAAFTRTLEGQIAAQRELNKELAEGIKSQRQLAREKLDSSRSALKAEETSKNALERELATARERAKKAEDRVRNPSALDDPEGAQANLYAAQEAARRVAALESRLKKINADIAATRQGIRDAQIPIAIDAAQAAVDPIAAVNKKYDEMVDRAKAAASANDRLTASLTKTLTTIEQQRKAALKKVQDEKSAERHSESDRRNGRLTANDVGGLLKGEFGGTITSTTGGKHVPGSYHYKGEAVDFVPKGGMGSTSKADVRKFLEGQGITLKELLGPGDKDHNDHFHVAFGRSKASPESLAKRQETARQQVLADDVSFTEAERQARHKLLDATARTTASETARDALIREDIDAEADAQKTKIGLQQAQGKITQAEADHLLDLNERTRAQRLQNVQVERQSQTIADQAQAQDRSLTADIALLQIQQDLAKTTAERRRLAEQILAKEQEQARLRLQQVLDDPKSSDGAKGQARTDLAARPAIEAGQRAQVDQQNEGPLERYRREIADVANNLDDSIAEIKVRGLESLTDGLTDAILHAKSFGDVFKNVAQQIIGDLIRIAIQQTIVNALAKSLGSIFGGIGGGVGGGGGDIVMGGAFTKFAGARAGGGPVASGKTYLVGENGPELFTAPGNGNIIPNHDLAALRSGNFRAPSASRATAAAAAATQGGGVVRIEIGEGGLFEARVTGISGRVSAQVMSTTAPALIGAAANKADAGAARRARGTIR